MIDVQQYQLQQKLIREVIFFYDVRVQLERAFVLDECLIVSALEYLVINSALSLYHRYLKLF